MVRIDLTYTGELRCRATHEPSGAEIVTDAPRDNHGKGEAFSPTDMLATSLGACMLTVMGIHANKSGWSIEGTSAHVEKHMAASGPRRVDRLVVSVRFPGAVAQHLDATARLALEDVAEHCPVRLSLGENIAVVTRYAYDATLAGC